MAPQRPHAVVVPYPGSGNINPALQLAKLLHRRGVYITFVNTEHNHRRVQATAASVLGREDDGFRFEAIPDGLTDADRAAPDHGSRPCAAPLRDLIARLSGGAITGVPPVTCAVATTLMSFALRVARELGIPSVMFWGGSAASLMGHMRLRDLRDRGYIPLKDASYLTNGYLERVLRHGAMGCFATHNDWNSTSESLAAGVPMVCWPGFADQFTNCKCVCEVWGVGLRLDAEVKREQVAGHVRKAMEAEEMRRSAVAWKAKAAEAVSPGGSSFENLQSMVKALNSV